MMKEISYIKVLAILKSTIFGVVIAGMVYLVLTEWKF
jgi:hypothetical protein